MNQTSPLKRYLRGVSQSLSIFQYCGRAIALVWSTDRRLTLFLASEIGVTEAKPR
ncbi:hypothetical protein [Phormidesmis priestleyi]|uniref:hypothetical protein n=1 Tax=Phormidesmis priestleyi TaxID=268141 RepID=UPI000B285D57|nr:hypothetical protein [Phormidesmis priestleyi]